MGEGTAGKRSQAGRGKKRKLKGCNGLKGGIGSDFPRHFSASGAIGNFLGFNRDTAGSGEEISRPE